ERYFQNMRSITGEHRINKTGKLFGIKFAVKLIPIIFGIGCSAEKGWLGCVGKTLAEYFFEFLDDVRGIFPIEDFGIRHIDGASSCAPKHSVGHTVVKVYAFESGEQFIPGAVPDQTNVGITSPEW